MTNSVSVNPQPAKTDPGSSANPEPGNNGQQVDPAAVDAVAAKVLPDSEKTKSEIRTILENGNGYNSQDSDKAALDAVCLNS